MLQPCKPLIFEPEKLRRCSCLTRDSLIGYEDTKSGILLGDGEIYFGFGDPVPVPEEAFDRQYITGEE